MLKRILILCLSLYCTCSFSQQVTKAEYFFNTDPGVGLATSINFTPADSINTSVAIPIPASLQKGLNLLYVRVVNNTGNWSEPEVFMIVVSTAPKQINKIEYFFNTDPGVGNATPISFSSTDSLNQVSPIPAPASLPAGLNKLYIRIQNTEKAWSEPEVYSFVISNAQSQINSGEYYWDNDPGFGNGTPFSYAVTDSVIRIENITVPALSNGIHRLFTRTKNTAGNWSMPEAVLVVVGSGTISLINSGEYYWDTDPGFGGGTPFNYAVTDSIIRIENITVPSLSSGPHNLYSRVKNTDGTWSMPEFIIINVCNQAITSPPASQTVCAGANVTFTVTATGSGLTYQWRKNGTDIPGATSSSYTINNVTSGDAGNYDVVITGSCGLMTSSPATLTVNPVTVITTQPASQSVCQGVSVTFSVTATGTGTLTYQWKKNGTNISGATAATYTISSVVAGDAGNYSVDVTGTCGTVTSIIAVLSISPATVITSQPVSQSACIGASVTFTVSATGGGSLSYQWKKDGTNIPGAIAATYTISSVIAGDAGNYSVDVTGSCGTVSSANATLTINAGTVINTQPSNQNVCIGATASFSVSATGAGTLTYQWKKNGVNIPSANNATYTIASVVAGDAANYSVDVTSSCGTTSSNSATLSIIPSTSITTQPVSQSICPGNNVTFSVVAAGNNITYQWRKNGTNIGGATSASYTINNVSAPDAGNYDVVVTGTCGTVASVTAILTVNTNTSITSQPANQTVCVGSNVSFNVIASGTNLTYQWRKNGTNIGGATSSTYTINNVAAGDAGNYDVVVTGACGTVTSSIAILTVNTTTTINVQPSSQAACPGNNVTFSVTATGINLTYQWRKNGTNINGATSASYTINNVSAGDAGNYDVVVTGICGTVTSSIAILTVNTTTTINVQPSSQAICPGNNVTFSVTATGTNLTYQWRKNGSNINGATSASYTINNVSAGDAGNYDVVVTGACGTVTSSVATLTVNATTTINVQPLSQAICPGNNVTFSVTATGTNLTYQWRKNGSNIGGATSASYTINNVSAADAGNYDVVVTGNCGISVSATAVLSIDQLPAITTQPVSQTAFVGTSVTFSVVASGTGLSYQWRKGGVNIPGATGSSYTISNVAPGDAGNYDVLVSGTCSPPALSTIAVLTVNTVSIVTQPSSLAVCVGSNASFTIVANGINLTYQWQISTSGGPFTNITGETNPTLNINAVSISQNGNQYRCVVSGSVISNAAVLTVNPLPIVTLLLPFDTLYLNSPLQTLSGGTPGGGIYSGAGISGGSLLPGTLSLGNYTITYMHSDVNGCSASATDIFSIVPKADKVNMYPIPSRDGQMTIVVSPDLVGSRAIIYNGAGQKMADWIINGRLTVYQFSWPSGFYTAVFRKANTEVSKQLIIAR